MSAHMTKPLSSPSPTAADPVERARSIVAETDAKQTPRLTGRAHKQRREIIAAVMEEHIAHLAVTVPSGDMRRALHSISRLRTLLGELKRLEGWTWENDESAIHAEPDPIYAAIEANRAAHLACDDPQMVCAMMASGGSDDNDPLYDAYRRTWEELAATKPTTPAGALALIVYLREHEQRHGADLDDGPGRALNIAAEAASLFVRRG